MSLQAGSRLGSYSVVSLLGAGGMGEVYRSRDTRLNRDVAIKILPPAVAADGDRLARFEREAQTLASLNHPNIAQIYGVLEDPPALVMELVDGQDLSDLIKRGPLPIAEALAIARQVADALAAAHEIGVIHRDLKPANIKVREDGAVKVLDFGLAKAIVADGASSSIDAMNSPTLTMRETRIGMVIGTAAYMAPEQARGKPVDRRADVWAFGVVLYEMLTGRRAFEGTEVSDVMAAVLKDPVAFDALPAGTPAPVRRLIRRCLEKDRARRLDSMAVAKLELDEALSPAELTAPSAMPAAAGSPVLVPSAIGRTIPWLLVAVMAIAIAAWAAIAKPWVRPAAAPALRVSAQLGLEGSLAQILTPTLAISPDGQMVAFSAHEPKGTASRLYLRRLDQLTAVPFAGTDGAHTPFFSPDGKWIGYFSMTQLWKISVNGGAPVALGEALNGRGATWGEDDVITYAPIATPGGRLVRVPASGGPASPLGAAVDKHITQRWPQALPGNRAILYTGHTQIDSFEDACLVVQTLDGAAPRLLRCGGYGWQYLPSGHVVYMHGGTLFAAPFDVSRLSIDSAGVPVLDGIVSSPTSGSIQIAFSRTGTGIAAYAPGESGRTAFPIELLDRDGKVTALPAPAVNWEAPAFSPDGRQLAMNVQTQAPADIWVYDIERNTMTRLTFGEGMDVVPVWTPDGKRLAYGSAQSGPPNLFWRPADGSGKEERLTTSPFYQVPGAWTPDGRGLVFMQQDPKGGPDIWLLPMEGDERTGLRPGTPRPLLATPVTETQPALSPDGKWMSYTSDESGPPQVYVRPFDGSPGKWQISTDSARWSLWSRKGSQLLFGGTDGRIHFVTYDTTGGTFRASRPQPWSPGNYVSRSVFSPFALHPDGTRIATSVQPASASALNDRIVLVTEFFDEIRRKTAK